MSGNQSALLDGPASIDEGLAPTPIASAPARLDRALGPKRWRTEWLAGIIFPLLILVLWEAVSRFHIVKPLFLPRPHVVALTFFEMVNEGRLLTDLRVSALVVLEGFALGASIGLAAGVSAGLSRSVERFFGPTLNAIRQVPSLAWLPLLVLWAGAGDVAKVMVISKAVFFPVFLNTLQGIRGVSCEYIEVGRIFGYSPQLMLRRIILPAALPSIFTGVRYGAGLAWAMIIAAEMLGGQYGLGYVLARSQEMLLTSQLFVVILIIGLVGFLVDFGLKRAETHLLRWKTGFEG